MDVGMAEVGKEGMGETGVAFALGFACESGREGVEGMLEAEADVEGWMGLRNEERCFEDVGVGENVCWTSG